MKAMKETSQNYTENLDEQLPKIQEAVYQALDSINETLPPQSQLAKSPSTPLYDPYGSTDSLVLTMLIVAVEQNVELKLGKPISLIGENVFAAENNALHTVDALCRYIAKILAK